MLSARLLARSQQQSTAFTFAQEETSRHVRALQSAPHVRFAADHHRAPQPSNGPSYQPANSDPQATKTTTSHAAGVNSLAVDPFEGRFLISGGADGSLSTWDLQAGEERTVPRTADTRNMPTVVTHVPLETRQKSSTTHTHGISSLNFYPFDSLAFLSSSYDHTLKVWSSTTLTPSASFDLSGVVYSASISPIATHLQVACATQHPAVRLVDLRSAAATQSLVGHTGGSVLSVAWSPKHEYVLSSGATDGTVRLWDVRRSSGCLGTLDLEDSVGVVGYDSFGLGSRSRVRGKAHVGPVNGVVWTDDARHIISVGHDERIRVWDTHTGANTLVSFGPQVRNRNFSTLLPRIAPKGLLPRGGDVLFYPNERDILMFEMFEGRLMKRLKDPNMTQSRVTALAWRAHAIELLSAHADGTIRSWQSRTAEDAMVESEEQEKSDPQKRKLDVLYEVERDLAGRNITFI